MKLIVLIILLFTSAFSQTDFVKWEKADYSYEISNPYRHRDYSFDSENAGDFVAKAFANAYWLIISDVDGDNCPFRPSCSSFFVQSAKETNVFQAALMFFDRFTRDLNVSKRHEHYPRVKSGYYYDPVSLYTLDEGSIKYISPSTIVKD